MSRVQVRAAWPETTRLTALEDDADNHERRLKESESRILRRIDELEEALVSKDEKANARITRLLVTATGLLGSTAVALGVALIGSWKG